MSAHTPGPLKADDHVVAWWGGDQPGCMVRKWTDGVGKPIANCLSLPQSNDVGSDEAVANARLFAGASVLKDALQQIAAGNWNFGNARPGLTVMQFAAEALDKAAAA